MKHNVVNRATPVMTEPHGTTDQKQSCCVTHVNAMQASPEWVLAQAELQGPVADWLKTSQDMKAKSQQLDDLIKQVAATRASLLVLVRQWATNARVCLGAVDHHCDGSKDKVKSLGWGVAGRTPRPPATMATNLQSKPTKILGLAIVDWLSDGRRHQYQVQHCTNPADPATYAAPVTVGRRVFKLAGQVPGATLHFRVLVLDPKLPAGQTEWTAWLAVTVS